MKRNGATGAVLPWCVLVLLCLLFALCGLEGFPLAACATLGVSEMPMAITPPQISAIPSSCNGRMGWRRMRMAPSAVNSGPVPRATG